MLDKSIQLNLQISEKHMMRALGCIFVSGGFLTFLFPAAGLLIFLAFRDLFQRSLFGEEAYTYMTVPISMRDVVIGKAVTANMWMMTSFAVLWISLLIDGLATGEMDLEFGIGGFLLQIQSGVFEAAEEHVISSGTIVTDEKQLLGAAMGLTVMPVVFLSRSIFLCSVMQLGTIIRHVLDPQRKNLLVTMSVVIGCLVVIVGTGAAREGLCTLVGGGITTIWTCLISILLPAALGIGLLAAAVVLLEKKYSLT